MPARQKLRRDDWPDPDRALWERLVQPGDLFDDSGALSHWRPRSLKGLEGAYGLWLAWLARADPSALSLPPHMRATPNRLNAWLADMATLQPITRLNRYLEIVRILAALDPAWRTDTHRRIERRLRNDANGHVGPRKQGRIIAGEVLYRQVRAELQTLWVLPPSHATALQVRDATLLLFLTILPLRRRNLAGLAMGKNLIRKGGDWTVDFKADEMKGRRAFSARVPDVLADALSRYVDTYRPLILAAEEAQSQALWIGDKGGPWAAHTLGLCVADLTRSRFGVSISPHLFRDCAVTTMILASPRTAALAGALLGHHTSETSRSHYLQARQIEAGRDLRARIDQIKRVHR